MLTGLATGRMQASVINIGAFFMALIGIVLLPGGNDMEGGQSGIFLAALAACGTAYLFVKGGDIAPGISSPVLTFWLTWSDLHWLYPWCSTNTVCRVESFPCGVCLVRH